MRRYLLNAAISLLLLVAVLSPWATILLSPQYAFAATIQTQKGSPLGNQAQRQGGTLDLSQAAAGGVVGVGGCLAAAGLTLGAALTWLAGLLGFNVVTSTKAVASEAAGGGVAVGAVATGLLVPVVAPATDLLISASNDYLKAITANTYVTATINTASLQKQTVFDCIAWALAKAIWRAVAASVIDWINSGFNGRPSFIQDLGRFMEGIADQVAGDIIQNSAFAFLCSPFSISIKISLAVSYRRTAPACKLSDVMKNIRSFMDSFSQGGWPAWLELIQENNNPYGGYVVGRAAIDLRISSAQANKMSQLNWSGGFLSKTEKVCNADANGQQKCTELIVTPGELIAQKAGQVIGEGNVQLLLADELNQIISALVSQLLQKALQSFSGLSGGSSYQDDYYRSSSYTGDLSSSPGGGITTGDGITTGGGITTGDGITTGGSITTGDSIDFGTGGLSNTVVVNNSTAAQIAQAIVRVDDFSTLNQTALDSIQESKALQSQVAACWNGKATSGALDTENLQTARTNAQTASTNVSSLTTQTTEFENNTSGVTASLRTLKTMFTQANTTTSQQQLADILYSFYALATDPVYAKTQQIGDMTTTVSSLQTSLAVQDSVAQTALQTCSAFPNTPTTTTP